MTQDIPSLLRQTIAALDQDTISPLPAESDPRQRPSLAVLAEFLCLCRCLFFPHYYSTDDTSPLGENASVAAIVERLHKLLTEQITVVRTLHPHPQGDAAALAASFVSCLPKLRRILHTDVEAAYLGDPASESYDEVISCYPAIKALINHRVAHELYRLHIPLLPRILSEMAHSETGIDIHPAAQIGEYFTIDHGTGVVIGATCIIGTHVKLYQGVTLGARSFPLDEEGNPVKNIPRHPILGNHVVVYSNATVLGRITIGDHVTIGGNLWLTHDVPAHTIVKQYSKEHDRQS